MIFDSSAIRLFHNGHVFYELVCLLSVVLPQIFFNLITLFSYPAPQWGAAHKLKSHLLKTQTLKVLPLNPGVGQYIAMHATLTARDFFLSCLFLHFRSNHLHFFRNLSRFFLCRLWLTHGSCVGPQNKLGHPAGGRFPC